MQNYYILARWIHAVILMGMTGMSFYLARMVSEDIRPLLIKTIYSPLIRYGALMLLALTSIAIYLLQAGLVGDGWSDMFSVEIWRDLSQTSFGLWWLAHTEITLLFIVVAFCSLRFHFCWPFFALLSLATYGLTGHTTVHDGGEAFFFSAIQIIHLYAASFWFGGLLVIVRLLPLLTSDLTRKSALVSLIRYSRAGHWAVAILFIAGIINIVSVTGWPVHLFNAAYWWWLLAKLSGVVILVILAVVNRYYWVPRFSTAQAQRAFYCMTVTEIVLLTAVIAVSSIFATLSPMPM